MKIIMVMVASVDGKITQGNNPFIYSWTSQEDQKHFFLLLEKHRLIVMGRKTYEVAKTLMRHNKRKLRVVLTRSPQKYKRQAIPGKLEFSSEDPYHLTSRLEKRGYSQMLLIGGAQINGIFLQKNLVDKIHLTMEPRLFGLGESIIKTGLVDVSLQLVHMN